VLCGFTTHELVEVAQFTVCGFVVDDQRQITIVKILKPFVPTDLFERIFPAITRKIQSNHPDIVIVEGASHCCWPGSALLRPTANFPVIG
jgi:hypothetical protein